MVNDRAEFLSFCAERGITIPVSAPAFDGKVHRFHNDGDKKGSKNGYYIGFESIFANQVYCYATVGSWKTGEQHTYKSGNENKLSPQQQQAFRQQRDAARQAYQHERESVQTSAAFQCHGIWQAAKLKGIQHPYLTLKAVGAYGIGLVRDRLLIPVRALNGQLTSLQFIFPDGRKVFKSGGRVKGCCHRFGVPIDNTIYIAEGYATGATIHQITGHAVAIAFNARNIIEVAKNLRSKYPDYDLVIAADNDRFTTGNPGVTCARQAADITGAEILIPDFPEGVNGTDFNDLMQLEVSDG